MQRLQELAVKSDGQSVIVTKVVFYDSITLCPAGFESSREAFLLLGKFVRASEPLRLGWRHMAASEQLTGCLATRRALEMSATRDVRPDRARCPQNRYSGDKKNEVRHGERAQLSSSN